MHKLKKGLKKKIKGKDHKDKGEDLFDPEQLAKYKKELEAKRALEAESEGNCSDSGHKEGHSSAVADQGDEEWQRFNQLTSGVDTILKKTTGDLDRIKESSYFQRNKPPPPDKKPCPQRPDHLPHDFHPTDTHAQGGSRWVDCDKDRGFEDADEDQEFQHHDEHYQEEAFGETVETTEHEEPAEPVEPEEEEPIVLGDELFDTSFLDAIASGEIKLAYIPDSPTEPEGDDPFDTSSADAVVKHIEEEAKKEKKRVNLGLAVGILTAGKDEHTSTTSESAVVTNTRNIKKKSRYRPQNVNLLGSFDSEGIPIDNSDTQSATATASEKVTHSSESHAQGQSVLDLLDDFTSVINESSEETLGTLILPVHLANTPTPVSEHTSQSQPTESSNNLKDILSEFETFVTPEESDHIPEAPHHEDPDEFLDDEFADLATESLHKTKPGPPKRPAPPTNLAAKQIQEVIESAVPVDEEPEEPGEPDPFDTSFVPTEAPEDHIVFENDTHDLFSPVKQEPIESTHYEDPFDTSVVAKLQPGKFELKFLEEEFAGVSGAAAGGNVEDDDDDFDFDPRKEEKSEITVAKPEPVPEPEIHPLDIVTESHATHDSHIESLVPQTESIIEDDPFDTSSVTISGAALPGKLELKFLEDEFGPQSISISSEIGAIVGESAQNDGNEDDEFDFDPRQGEPERPRAPTPVLIERTLEDIFDSDSALGSEIILQPVSVSAGSVSEETASVGIKPKPKFSEEFTEDEHIDPFDTSCVVVDEYIPKAELKSLEAELLNSATDYKPPPRAPIPIKNLSSTVPRPVATPKPPSPVKHRDTFDFHDDEDNLEDHPAPLQPHSLTQHNSVFEPGFKHSEVNRQISDPFDTSIAGGVGNPGKIELKLLESELGVHPQAVSDDPDFDPRGSKHPSVGLTCLPLIPQSVKSATVPVPSAAAQPTANFDADAEIDPFDTSAADSLVYGNAEAKLLEAELL